MIRWFFSLLIISVLAGCSSRPSRDGVMSQELPLTLDDLGEIREGEKNHALVLEEYSLYESPKLEVYLNAIAANIAAVSTRRHLPYKVILLDDDEVNVFGGPGGYIYITRGLMNFVQSESEIAGILSHEVAHISAYEYSHIPHHTKGQKVYNWMMKGTELASESIGSYGTMAKYGLKGVKYAAPRVVKRFSKDQEIVADELAVKYMLEAGYDPRGIQEFNERLARVEIQDVNRFVNFMNTHPPFQDRRELLEKQMKGVDFEEGKIEFKKDTLTEVRQQLINQEIPQEPIKAFEEKPQTVSDAVFKPTLGVHLGSPAKIDQVSGESDKFNAERKRYSWF